jgi:hypothetical protein
MHIFCFGAQVWYTAVTSSDGKQGGVSSSTKANSGKAARKLRIEAVHILGVPTAAAPPAGATGSKAPVKPAAAAAATASLNGKPVAAAYDSKVGVVKITGLKDAVVGMPFSLRWKI